MQGEAVGSLAQGLRTVHRFGPGDRRAQSGECRMQNGLMVEFGAAPGDFGVESFNAEVEAFGFRFADAVVFGGWKLSEVLEGVGVRGRSGGGKLIFEF